MNEKLNLVEMLKDCPEGTKLWSDIYSEVTFSRIDTRSIYPIVLRTQLDECRSVASDGRASVSYNGFCTLWPSKDCRDWSKFKPKKPKFDPKTLRPFDKVLRRDYITANWKIELFSHIGDGKMRCMIATWKYVIPYNDETKHLLGTEQEAPEFYRYWEE